MSSYSKYYSYLAIAKQWLKQSNTDIVPNWAEIVFLPRLAMVLHSAQLRDISVQDRLPKWLCQKQKASGKQNCKRKISAITVSVLTECVTNYLLALSRVLSRQRMFCVASRGLTKASKLCYPKSDTIDAAIFNNLAK